MNYVNRNLISNALCRVSLQILQTFPKQYAKKEAAGVSMVGGALKKKKLGKLGPAIERRVLPVETDQNRLVQYVCGTNIYKEGEDVKLKPDVEYPEWLWNVRTGPLPTIESLEPDTKEYWKRIRKMALRRNNKLRKLKPF